MGLIFYPEVPKRWSWAFLTLVEHSKSISDLQTTIKTDLDENIVIIQKNIIFENLNFWKFEKPLTVILTAIF